MRKRETQSTKTKHDVQRPCMHRDTGREQTVTVLTYSISLIKGIETFSHSCGFLSKGEINHHVLYAPQQTESVANILLSVHVISSYTHVL